MMMLSGHAAGGLHPFRRPGSGQAFGIADELLRFAAADQRGDVDGFRKAGLS